MSPPRSTYKNQAIEARSPIQSSSGCRMQVNSYFFMYLSHTRHQNTTRRDTNIVEIRSEVICFFVLRVVDIELEWSGGYWNEHKIRIIINNNSSIVTGLGGDTSGHQRDHRQQQHQTATNSRCHFETLGSTTLCSRLNSTLQSVWCRYETCSMAPLSN